MRLLTALLWVAAGALASEPLRLEVEGDKLGIPFDRFMTTDTLGRTITFYLSVPLGQEQSFKRPVALYIGGSGCQSAFKQLGPNTGGDGFQRLGPRVVGGFHTMLWQQAKERARILVVEKPGVKFLDDPHPPGMAEGTASEEFLKEHTLPRWAEANAAALRAVLALGEIDARRTLVVGLSEGGIVAARVAAQLPRVTHVASLCGGGPTQLFDFVANAGHARPDDKSGEAGRRVQAVFDAWSKIQKDPQSTTEFWLGHPYRRWSSFLTNSVTDELLRANARVYIASGTEDRVIPIAAHDMLVAELRARSRDVTAERLEGLGHGFVPATPPGPGPPGPPVEMQAVLERVLKWFLAER